MAKRVNRIKASHMPHSKTHIKPSLNALGLLSICASQALTIPTAYSAEVKNYNYYRAVNQNGAARAATAIEACKKLRTGFPAQGVTTYAQTCYVDSYGTRYIIGTVYLVRDSCAERVEGTFCVPSAGKGVPDDKQCPLTGNPINYVSGNKLQVYSDILATHGLQLSISYNSLSGLWLHGFSDSLQTDRDRVILSRSDGLGVTLTADSDTSYRSGTHSILRKGGTYHYRNGTTEKVFDSSGKLTLLRSPERRYEIKRTGQKLEIISGSQRMYITETALMQPESIFIGTAGVEISFTYNKHLQLEKITTYRNGHKSFKIFHYEDLRDPKLLTGITDERGVRYATWKYDEQGRAISSEHTGALDKVLLNYDSNLSTTVTNELGKKTTYRFSIIDGSKRITSIEGQPSANCPDSNSTFTYDSRGLLKTKVDNKGNLTTYDYNSRGLEISRTEAAGTSEARTISTEWHPTLFLPLVVSEPDRITRYQYDDQGRQLSRAVEAR